MKTKNKKALEATTANKSISIEADLLDRINEAIDAKGEILDEFLESALDDYTGVGGVPVRLFIPKSVMRLALQLREDPEVLIHRLIRRGVQAVDWNMMHDIASPFAWRDEDGFDSTEELAKLDIIEVFDLEDDGVRAQRVLYLREMERRRIAKVSRSALRG